MIKRKGLPDRNELVMCTVTRITPYAAWCDIEEYDAEGMIHVSEAAGRWVHDIKDHVKQGKQYVVKVVKIDDRKNMVSLSLKRVSKRDKKEKINAFRQEQRAEKVLEQAGKELKKDIRKSYDEVGYLLQEKFGELSTAFEEAKKDPSELSKAGVPKKWTDVLMPVIEIAFKDKEIVLKAEIDLKSYESDGLDRVKKVLGEVQKAGMEVRYLSAPKYTAEVLTKDPKTDEKKMRATLDGLIEKSKDFKVDLDYEFVK